MLIFMGLVIFYEYMLINVNLLNTNLDLDSIDYLLIHILLQVINYVHYYLLLYLFLVTPLLF